MDNKLNAFTLAEVLITLGIIGVVAAMTLPTLVLKYQEKETVTALKKFYSQISQAYLFAVGEHGTPDLWGLNAASSENMITYIKPYLKFDKICRFGDGSVCHTADNLYFRSGGKTSSHYMNPWESKRTSAVLADGMIVNSFFISEDCSSSRGTGKFLENVCGEYVVDVNGSKKPNMYGKDIFIFLLTKFGVIPLGGGETFLEVPENSTIYSFELACLPSNATGFGCAAWVIENENLDYLHCDDLSWDGKRKCK